MSKRKNVLYYDLGNGYFVEVVENQVNNRLDFFTYSADYPELKVQYPGPAGNLRQNFKTLETSIKETAKEMIREYHKEPYIRNRCDKTLPVLIDESQLSLKKMFNNVFYSELKDGYSVEVEELQKFQDGLMVRNYFICDNTQSYKYRVLHAEGELASFSPMDELIANEHNKWIDEENEKIITAICNELTDIKEYLDDVIIGNFRFKMFMYNDDTFCVHSYDSDTDMFYKYASISDAYKDLAQRVDEQLNKVYTQNIELNIRKRLNRCRRHIADKNDMLFVSEMSIIKGLLYTYNNNSIELSTIVPDELYVKSFVDKYESLTGDKFLNLNI